MAGPAMHRWPTPDEDGCGAEKRSVDRFVRSMCCLQGLVGFDLGGADGLGEVAEVVDAVGEPLEVVRSDFVVLGVAGVDVGSFEFLETTTLEFGFTREDFRESFILFDRERVELS